MDYFDIENNLKSVGLIPKEIIIDGEIHRVPTAEKPSQKDGWYVCYDNHVIAGNWRTGVQQTFKESGYTITNADKRQIQASIERSKIEKRKQQAEAAILARELFDKANTVIEHKYLNDKAINNANGIRVLNSQLLIPLYDIQDGTIKNIQRIYPDGIKRFLKNGQIKGLAFPCGNFQGNKGAIHFYVCEGFATAVSIYQMTNSPVLAAMNAGNLLHVAKRARAKWSDANIIIAADDDALTFKSIGVNPGIDKATEAARIIGASISVPPFTPEQRMAGLSDWNDYALNIAEVTLND